MRIGASPGPRAGRNHHSNAMGGITEIATGFPGYDGRIPFRNGLLSEMLVPRGYNAFAIGKWHLTPTQETSPAGPYDRWPLGRGFERFYGFLGGETNQWVPDLVYDQHPAEPPETPEDGYHLTEDLADRAIEFLKGAHEVAPDKPFFLYFCPGACHAPHHVPGEWADRYTGKFDIGWDAAREKILGRQKEMGIVPPATDLSPRPDEVQAWDSLSDDEKRLYARMMEVFAGFLSHTDHHIGRLIAFLEELGKLENTLVFVVSDNGASAEGGATGSVNENRFFNNVAESVADNLAMIDELGGPKTYNHYPWGWTLAGNTPLKRWKRETFQGGTTDPLIVSWPKGIRARGEIRNQYVHAIDLVPTVLEAAGIEPPAQIRGVDQSLDGRGTQRLAEARPQVAEERKQYTYYPGGLPIPEDAAADIKNRSYTLTAEVEIPDEGAEGVILAQGGRFGGYSLFIQDGKLHYVHNYVGVEEYRIASREEVPSGVVTLRFAFDYDGGAPGSGGTGTLHFDGRQVGEGRIERTVPIAFALSGEGLCCGWDSGEPVSEAYASPFRFSGRIRRVTVDVSGAPVRDLESEMDLALTKQ